MKDAPVVIRPATRDDLPGINLIYNQYVAGSHVTFDVEPWTIERRAEWFAHHALQGRHRLLVAAGAEGVAGYATSSPYRPRKAYDVSVETSVYLDPRSTGRGLGARLYAELFAVLEGEDVHRACAGITLPNPASVALHERLGFTRVGVFSEQGRKLGRYWDVAWYERRMR